MVTHSKLLPLTVDQYHQHHWGACQKRRPSGPTQTHSTRICLYQDRQRTLSTQQFVKCCSRSGSGESHLIYRCVHSPSEGWAYLYCLYLQSRPVVGINSGKAWKWQRAVIRNNNVCPQPALQMQSQTHPTFRALPCDRFNWAPITPPSVEFIVYQVRTFHTVSLSQTFHPKNR